MAAGDRVLDVARWEAPGFESQAALTEWMSVIQSDYGGRSEEGFPSELHNMQKP